MEFDQSSCDDVAEPLSTATPSFSVQARGVVEAETATKVATLVGKIIRALGRHIGLQTLDGVTIAFDYDQALLDLDRGYDSSHQLQATKSHVYGVAMTPSVIRDGELKSHILVRFCCLCLMTQTRRASKPPSMYSLTNAATWRLRSSLTDAFLV